MTAAELVHVVGSAVELTVGIDVVREVAQLKLMPEDAISLRDGQRLDGIGAEGLHDAQRGKRFGVEAQKLAVGMRAGKGVRLLDEQLEAMRIGFQGIIVLILVAED